MKDKVYQHGQSIYSFFYSTISSIFSQGQETASKEQENTKAPEILNKEQENKGPQPTCFATFITEGRNPEREIALLKGGLLNHLYQDTNGGNKPSAYFTSQIKLYKNFGEAVKQNNHYKGNSRVFVLEFNTDKSAVKEAAAQGKFSTIISQIAPASIISEQDYIAQLSSPTSLKNC